MSPSEALDINLCKEEEVMSLSIINTNAVNRSDEFIVTMFYGYKKTGKRTLANNLVKDLRSSGKLNVLIDIVVDLNDKPFEERYVEQYKDSSLDNRIIRCVPKERDLDENGILLMSSLSKFLNSFEFESNTYLFIKDPVRLVEGRNNEDRTALKDFLETCKERKIHVIMTHQTQNKRKVILVDVPMIFSDLLVITERNVNKFSCFTRVTINTTCVLGKASGLYKNISGDVDGNEIMEVVKPSDKE